MRATIIVRKRQPDTIASLVCVDTLDEKTVRDTVAELEQRYPKSHYRVDTSQVELARRSLAAA